MGLANLDETVARAMRSAAEYIKPHYARMPDDQKKHVVQTYRDNGYSDRQIAEYTGITPEPAVAVRDVDGPGTVPLSDKDAVFSADELNKPGLYEIVFRTPPDNQLLYRGDNEIHMSITFTQFR